MRAASVPIERLYLGLYDGPHATPKPSDEGPIFLGIGNITEDGKLDLTDVRHIAEEDFANWTKRVTPRAGDIVFTYEATLNRYAIIPDGFQGCLGRRTALIRPNPAAVNPRFLFFYFFSEDWRRTIDRNILSGATVDRIPLTTFPSFPVTLPSRSIQDRIAETLSAYDDLIENNTRRIKILEDMAQMLYREWFVNFRFPGHESVPKVESQLGPIPKGWAVQSLGSLTSVITKGTTPTTLGRQFRESGVNFVKVESITESGAIIIDKLAKIDTDTHELLKRSQLRQDDILFSIAGAIGRVAVVPLRVLPANTNQALAIIRCSDPTFVTYLLSTVRSTHFQNFSLGRVVQTAQANVSLSILKSVPILVPPSMIEVVPGDGRAYDKGRRGQLFKNRKPPYHERLPPTQTDFR
jgi:type I restriction enzyme, S subunit